MTTRKQYPLFSNGSEYMCWLDQNCDRCMHGPTEEVCNGESPATCSIEQEIALECIGEQVSENTYNMLRVDESPWVKKCPKFIDRDGGDNHPQNKPSPDISEVVK